MRIKPLDTALMQKAQSHLDNLTKPQGSLGALEELAKRIAGMTGKLRPKLSRKVIFTFAADHGIAAAGVSAYPQEVTRQMVYNFLSGGAAINVLARHVGAEVIVADQGVAGKLTIPAGMRKNFRDERIAEGTQDMSQGPAMSLKQARLAIDAGRRIFRRENKRSPIDIVGTGDMGIGNTTASSAITAVITGFSPAKTTGRGTVISDQALRNKIALIKKSIRVNHPDPQDGLDILSKVGGFEIAGLAGVILEAASARVPVMLDGFISTAAALSACRIEPQVKDYMIAGHLSVERGHRIALDFLGLKPLLDLDLRLGEGTGAALGIGLAEAALKIMDQMATFGGAGVAKKND